MSTPHHVTGAGIQASLTGLTGLLAMTQRLASALSVIAAPVQEAQDQGMDPAAHYRLVASQKALHAAQVLAEVQGAAVVVAQAAAAGAALVQPQKPAA